MKRQPLTESEMAAIEQATKTLTDLLYEMEHKAAGPYLERYLLSILRLQRALTA